jgi:hypothetical protein
MVMFDSFLYVYQRVNLHFPSFSYGFPMVFPLKTISSHIFPSSETTQKPPKQLTPRHAHCILPPHEGCHVQGAPASLPEAARAHGLIKPVDDGGGYDQNLMRVRDG